MTYEAYDEPEQQASSKGFANQLSRDVARIAGYGIDGLHENKYEKGKLEQDKSTARNHFNFYMKDSIFQLGCDLEKAHKIFPVSWASWMMNCDINIGEKVVTIFCPGGWRTSEAEKKFKSALISHFNGKAVKFRTSDGLEREMKNL